MVTAHAGLPERGGFHGVTVFFVISGYLITTLLVSELTVAGRIRVLPFYRRRLARLGPALVLACAATVAYLVATGASLATWGQGLLGALTYTTDFIESFATAPHAGLFEPTWTLAVEEQFYLLWPFVLFLCWRGRSPIRNVRVACAGLLVLSWLNRARFEAGQPSHGRLFYSFDSHADALLLGCLIAAALAGRAPGAGARLAAALLGSLGVVALVVVYFRVDLLGRLSFDQVGFGEVALASAAVVGWLAVTPSGALGRILGVPPLAYLGRLSYGIYLYNLLLADAFRRAFGEDPIHSGYGGGYLVVLLLVAAASYHWVERPLRRAWAGRAVAPARELAGSAVA